MGADESNRLPPFAYIPMHEVVPNAVSTAVITDAMICSVHFNVSLLLIIHLLPDGLLLRTSRWESSPDRCAPCRRWSSSSTPPRRQP